VYVLAIADVWIGGILALSGAALGVAGTLLAEWQRHRHERRQYWKRDQFEVIREAHRLLDGAVLGLREPGDPEVMQAILDVTTDLMILAPISLVRAFSDQMGDWRRDGTVDVERYERFNSKAKRFLGID
jgi:hypothetical protein